MLRIIASQAERQDLSRRAYQMHVDGHDDVTIAEKLFIEVYQATSMRQWWADNRVETPEHAEAKRTAIARAEADLANLSTWQERLETAYRAHHIDIEKAGKLAVSIARCRTDIGVRYAKLLGLDAPLNVNVTATSPVDAAIMDLSAEFAQMEGDLPL